MYNYLLFKNFFAQKSQDKQHKRPITPYIIIIDNILKLGDMFTPKPEKVRDIPTNIDEIEVSIFFERPYLIIRVLNKNVAITAPSGNDIEDKLNVEDKYPPSFIMPRAHRNPEIYPPTAFNFSMFDEEENKVQFIKAIHTNEPRETNRGEIKKSAVRTNDAIIPTQIA